MDVVFLDANVLFSAAYQAVSGLRRLWDLHDVELITSQYAVEEARRNLDEPIQRDRLVSLLRFVRIVGEVSGLELPAGVALAEKDRPILLAAIAARATHLLTGDLTHFGALYGTSIGGVRILPPAEYLRVRET